MVQSQHVQELSLRSRKGSQGQLVRATSVRPQSTSLNSNSRPKKTLPSSSRTLRNQQPSPEQAAPASKDSRRLSASIPYPGGRSKVQQPAAKTLTTKAKRQESLAAAAENAQRLRASSDNDEPGYEDEEQADEDEDVFNAGLGRPLPVVNFAEPTINRFNGSDDDEIHEPEVARRPHISGKKRRVLDRDDMLDDDDDGIPPLAGNDSDFDDPINSPTRQVQDGRKRKSTGATFSSPTISKVSSKLPSKKPNAARPSTPATGSPARSHTSSPRTPQRSAGLNARRPRLGDQSPHTQGLVKTAAAEVRLGIFVCNAFPDRVEFTEECKTIFVTACQEVQARLHELRYSKSPSYRSLILALLRQKLPQARQEVRNAALAKTAMHYGINPNMGAGEIATRVEELKHQVNYVMGDMHATLVKNRKPYQNPLIQTLINTLFFEGKRKSDAAASPASWNPMPLPVIALVCTAIHSALDDWETGKNEASKNKFSHDRYAPVYEDHIANLAKFKSKNPATLARLQTALWNNAWASSGSAPLTGGHASIDDDDIFGGVEVDGLE